MWDPVRQLSLVSSQHLTCGRFGSVRSSLEKQPGALAQELSDELLWTGPSTKTCFSHTENSNISSSVHTLFTIFPPLCLAVTQPFPLNLHFFSAVEQQFPASTSSQSQICAITDVVMQQFPGKIKWVIIHTSLFLHLILSTAPHQSASVPVHQVGSTLIQICCRQHTDYRLRTSKYSHVK